MRKRFFLIVFLFVLTMGIHANAQTPDYQKYGRIAISVVKEDYPGDEVRDYQYMGRKELNGDQVVDSFQFKVSADGVAILATVQITHSLKNNKLLNLTVREDKPS